MRAESLILGRGAKQSLGVGGGGGRFIHFNFVLRP